MRRLLAVALLYPHLALAEGDDAMQLINEDGFAVRAHLQVGVNAVAERNLFWNYANEIAPSAHFDSDTEWLEGYVEPGISFAKDAGGDLTAYGKVSIVASGTLGSDAYGTGDTGRTTLEEGYIGIRSGSGDGGLSYDLSVGPREFRAGTGMLIANGGSNGFERGALKLGPRKAWAFAALANVGVGGFSSTAFYLKSNELPDNDGGTTIGGADLRYDSTLGNFAGVTFGHVRRSSSPYPQAAPGGIGAPNILPGARDGLNFLSFYGRNNPFDGALENLFVGGDFAYEWNHRVDLQAWAARAQIGYGFTSLPLSPVLSYSYQTFSGDDPLTSKLERFDPLNYEGNPSSWATGSKSSMVFINSNVNAHLLSLQVSPSTRDTVTLRYAHISANELGSPIQFGQATRPILPDGVPILISGVTSYHLSDDFFLEYIRALTPNIYLTADYSLSIPGPGVDSVTLAEAPIWTGGFVNVVFNY